MINLILLFFSLTVFSGQLGFSKNAFEKSYPRDNTYCTHSGKRIEFLIRGETKYTEPKEKGYGELIFYQINNEKPKLVTLNDFQSDTYRFFAGKSDLCSKSYGFEIDSSTIAILFLKENRPFKDKLVIQLLDSTTLSPTKFIETTYTVDQVEKIKNGFSFRSFKENYHLKAGRVTIGGNPYIFHQKEFPQWFNYVDQKFEMQGERTFNQFPWKMYFKDQNDFYSVSGWKKNEKVFQKEFLFLAINHQLKKGCFLVSEINHDLKGNEDWRCQDL